MPISEALQILLVSLGPERKYYVLPVILVIVCFSVTDTAVAVLKNSHPEPGNISASNTAALLKKEDPRKTLMHEELFVPGDVYYLKRNFDTNKDSDGKNRSNDYEYFTLWKRQPGQHFQNILLSNKLISDHKCDSHYYALRDVLKGLPFPCPDESIFR